MKHLILISILVHSFAVVAYGQGLTQSSSATQYFSEREIAQLHELLLSFETQIGHITGQQGNERYDRYLQLDSTYVAGKTDDTSYSIPAEVAQRILYALDSSLFNKLFAYSYELDPSTRRRTSRSVSPRADGPYVRWGTEIGKTNELWQRYFEAVSRAGDISPTAVTLLPRAARQYVDLSNPEERLFIALHYLLTMAPAEEV